VISLKLLTALNHALDRDEFNIVMNELESGVIGAVVEDDLIVSLYLTETGRAVWPIALPATTA
jgi:hypothetical protein